MKKTNQIMAAIIFIFGLMQINCFAADKSIKDLKITVGIFMEEDADFFNQHLRADDIVFTYGGKLNLLRKITVAKKTFGRQSIEDIEKDLAEFNDVAVDYINYNPEKWRSSHTPEDEKNNRIDAVKRAKKIASQKNAKLSFGTDHILFEKYGEQIAPYVDLFGVQMQRLQRETIDEFRNEAAKNAALIKKGNPSALVYFQVSLAPPKWETKTAPNGKSKKVLSRDKDQKKVMEPIKPDEIFAQIEAIKDLADGIVIYYNKETRDEMKELIRHLRD